MRRYVFFALPSWVFIAFSPLIGLASQRFIPLPELAAKSDAIMIGRIVKMEKTEIKEGVNEVICSIRIDSILKGTPGKKKSENAKKKADVVTIIFWDGKNVPDGGEVHDLGESGIWFLYRTENAPRGPYQGVRRDISEIKELRELLRSKQGEPKSIVHP